MPVTADAVADGLVSMGIRLAAGVPCSYFAGLLRLLESPEARAVSYVPAANEGAAVAIAAGAYLSGTQAAVLAQNSGFGNMVNPLTSLVLPYRIPLLVLMSMRGWPEAEAGEEQHFWMGKTAARWLSSLGVPYWFLRVDGEPLDELFAGARQALDDSRPAFILVARGAIKDSGAPDQPARPPGPRRSDLVRALLAEVTDQCVLSTTGYLSRELFSQGDRAANFYMQGSMGHVASVALGAAIARPDRRFVVLDGDGAALMHLGALATVGHVLPGNLTHIIFDNGAYESTGGQPTGANRTDFGAVGRACGYLRAYFADSSSALRPVLRAALADTGPTIVVVRGGLDAVPGERASAAWAPAQIASRFAREVCAAPGPAA